jgi:DNA helicase-2/ATP-dependent DNA helicase PcrA
LHTTLRGDDADAVGSDAVELLTFHRAKGLEFHTVFVTGLERGLVPISHAKSSEALDEEQRLLYVASSRAERMLHLSWAQTRTIGMRNTKRSPSPWLSRIERAIASVGGHAEITGDARSHIADARDRATVAGGTPKSKRERIAIADTDAPLLDALMEWRLKLSRGANVPAYVIFNNTTLADIATARPRTRRDLLDVAGIGPVKAERYGDAVLGLVREHAAVAAT